MYKSLLTFFWSLSIARLSSFLYLKVSSLSISSCILVFTLATCLNMHLFNMHLFISIVIDLFEAPILFCHDYCNNFYTSGSSHTYNPYPILYQEWLFKLLNLIMLLCSSQWPNAQGANTRPEGWIWPSMWFYPASTLFLPGGSIELLAPS